jgi:glycosyltransferase involved in cell wall biosynthesis
MNFSLIICTYLRPKALLTLLKSVKNQVLCPNEIIIVDGSTNDLTKQELDEYVHKNLKYFKVTPNVRGLTKQRNFGISKVSDSIDIVCFLDDDIVLTKTYFKILIDTYSKYPDAGGVGGYIINDVKWRKLKSDERPTYNDFQIDGYIRDLGSRNIIRKKLGLLSSIPPCFMPKFSNGFSVGNLPPNKKVYKAEYFMGGVSSFKKHIVDSIKFSNYFKGYGLYEDMDYCLRVSKKHKLYVNTGAQLYHYHASSGRPNKYTYGKMVIRNGWYVWRVKYPSPSVKSRFKWNMIALLLTIIRFSNILTTKNKAAAFTESIGRILGWYSLLFNKPKIEI